MANVTRIGFPAVDKKLTRGLSPVSYVLQDEGDELAGQYAGTAPFRLNNGKTVVMHYFVTEEGVASVMSRYQIDKFLTDKKVQPGTDVRIVRGKDRSFKKDGEKRTLYTFKCEVA